MNLHAECDGGGDPLVLLHGFTTNSESWRPMLADLEVGHTAIRIDLPGHGRSPTPPNSYNFDACVADILGVLDRLNIDQTDLLGYSMGGRIALALTCTAPHRVRKLVLESASPGLADGAARTERKASDRRLAEEIRNKPLSQFIERWLEQPLFRTLQHAPQSILAQSVSVRMKNSAPGLAAALHTLGTGSQPSMWDRLSALPQQTMLLTGALDEKFQRIADEMHLLMPNSRRTVVADAGHTTHLEKAEDFVREVLDFLAERPAAEKPQ